MSRKEQHNYSGDPTLVDVRLVRQPTYYTNEEIAQLRTKQEKQNNVENFHQQESVVFQAEKREFNYSGDPVWVELSTLSKPIQP